MTSNKTALIMVIGTLAILGVIAYGKTIPSSEFERISWEQEDAMEDKDWATADSLFQIMASMSSFERIYTDSYTKVLLSESRGQYVPDSLVFDKNICDRIKRNKWKYHKECEVFE